VTSERSDKGGLFQFSEGPWYCGPQLAAGVISDLFLLAYQRTSKATKKREKKTKNEKRKHLGDEPTFRSRSPFFRGKAASADRRDVVQATTQQLFRFQQTGTLSRHFVTFVYFSHILLLGFRIFYDCGLRFGSI
jgi:hypothetical protein